MTGLCNLFDQFGLPVGDPAEHVEGGLGRIFIEQRQQHLSIAGNAQRMAVPGAAINRTVKGSHLEIVFHVEREGVQEFLHTRGGYRNLRDSTRSARQMLAGTF